MVITREQIVRADGPEQRTFENAEASERYYDRILIDEDSGALTFERAFPWSIPATCIVNGHKRGAWTWGHRYCTACGERVES